LTHGPALANHASTAPRAWPQTADQELNPAEGFFAPAASSRSTR
jgi:hypothetical protein